MTELSLCTLQAPATIQLMSCRHRLRGGRPFDRDVRRHADARARIAASRSSCRRTATCAVGSQTCRLIRACEESRNFPRSLDVVHPLRAARLTGSTSRIGSTPDYGRKAIRGIDGSVPQLWQRQLGQGKVLF